MIYAKRLREMARKLQRAAVLGFPDVACRGGYFTVYSMDGKRFVVPLAFLKSRIFNELLQMSEEEFGSPGDGPIILPCDAVTLERALCMLRRRASEEVENEILISSLGVNVVARRDHPCTAYDIVRS